MTHFLRHGLFFSLSLLLFFFSRSLPRVEWGYGVCCLRVAMCVFLLGHFHRQMPHTGFKHNNERQYRSMQCWRKSGNEKKLLIVCRNYKYCNPECARKNAYLRKKSDCRNSSQMNKSGPPPVLALASKPGSLSSGFMVANLAFPRN